MKMVINGEWITTEIELEAAIKEMDALSKEIMRVKFRGEEINEKTAPLSCKEAAKALVKSSLEARMVYGWEIVKDFRLFSTSLTDEQGYMLLETAASLVVMLELGMLQQAAAMLDMVEDNEVMLMKATFFGAPAITIKQYFVEKIMQGDPL